MALVMLPCELPWWSSVQNHLKKLSQIKNTIELVEVMHKIHELCNVSLDPDEETTDPELFVGLLNFLDNDLNTEERQIFFNKTLPNIIKRALSLKEYKPKRGLHFSLQQQPDCIELEYNLVSSLIANAFFSTFPKRTNKSHPTLQDFNFTNFFKHLQNNHQKSKLKAIFHYFDWLEENDNATGSIKVLRQVMSSKEWLTIEDWLECSLPLCPLQIKHEGKMDRVEPSSVYICFSGTKIGGQVLANGNSQESITLVTFPELLCLLLNIEALEDNEVVTVEKVRNITRIVDPKKRAFLEKLESPQQITISCIDAEDYTHLPIGQYEEDNILRELNKCLLAFQQKQLRTEAIVPNKPSHRTRRLSPIGESMGSNTSDTAKVPLITQTSCSTTRSRSKSPKCDNSNLKVNKEQEKRVPATEGLFNNRRGRFIVLGSSGECLPVKRKPESSTSIYSSFESIEDEFYSAKTSLEGDSEDEQNDCKYGTDLETPERRLTFAQRLRDALKRETSSITTVSEDSSYAVGILVGGSSLADQDIRLRRGGSRGFMLNEESINDEFRKEVYQEAQWVSQFKSKNPALSKKESNKSSEYSFSSEYSSELEEVYEQLTKWIQDPIIETDTGTKKKRELDSRDLAVVEFAGSLLKRALSESFAGVNVSNGCENTESNTDASIIKKNKLILNAKSLSLELARHKHRLAAQLLSQISNLPKNGLKSITTGNWGCGESKQGELQLKVVIQWLAASVAGVPALIYYTCGHSDLVMLDTVYRILRDRRWSVKDLAQATLRFSHQVLHGRNSGTNLFEDLIGVERTS